jgi:hypothetical protein
MKKTIIILTMVLTTSVFAQIPTNGLEAYYPFTGNANDMSGYGNNGTVNGATLMFSKSTIFSPPSVTTEKMSLFSLALQRSHQLKRFS